MKTKPQRGTVSPTDETIRLSEELAQVREELATVNRFLEKIHVFSVVMSDAKATLKELKEEEREVADHLSEIRDRIKSLKDSISSTSDGMIALIEPGPVKFMPLFDRMEKASPQKHGTNAVKWRELPLSALRLSPTSTSALYEAEILFIGQLQDKVLADPEGWWKDVPGITAPIAAAIADKLTDFSKKGGDV